MGGVIIILFIILSDDSDQSIFASSFVSIGAKVAFCESCFVSVEVKAFLGLVKSNVTVVSYSQNLKVNTAKLFDQFLIFPTLLIGVLCGSVGTKASLPPDPSGEE